MKKKRRPSAAALLFGMLLLAAAARAQAPALTTVQDTVYSSDGTPFSGNVVITWGPFLDPVNKPVPGGIKSLSVTNGALAVALVPNAGAKPSGTSYSVKFYQSNRSFEEFWVIPASSPLANPAQPVSVTQAGTPGAVTYYYWCTATNTNGETLLSPSLVTTTSHATLDATNYNIITCATVSGATGYNAYRTTTSTAPTGTGNFLVGSSATTVINDQSNTLASASIPALNTTDPKTVAHVRVLAAPTVGQVGNADTLDTLDSTAFVQTTGNQSIAGTKTFSQQIVSTVTTGTAPFSVTSTTEVANLRAATATALAADPAACPAGQFGNDTNAAGALSCAAPPGDLVLQVGAYWGLGGFPSGPTTVFFGEMWGDGYGIFSSGNSPAKVFFPRSGTVTKIRLTVYNGSTGSNEASTISFRLNNTTDTTISSAVDNSQTVQHLEVNPSISVSAGDYFEFKWGVPGWSVPPSSIAIKGWVLVQ